MQNQRKNHELLIRSLNITIQLLFMTISYTKLVKKCTNFPAQIRNFVSKIELLLEDLQ